MLSSFFIKTQARETEQPDLDSAPAAKCSSADGSGVLTEHGTSSLLSSAMVAMPIDVGRMLLESPGSLQKEGASETSSQRVVCTDASAAVFSQVLAELRNAVKEHRSSRDAFTESLEARCAAILGEMKSVKVFEPEPPDSEGQSALMAEVRVLRGEVGSLREELLRELQRIAVSAPPAFASLHSCGPSWKDGSHVPLAPSQSLSEQRIQDAEVFQEDRKASASPAETDLSAAADLNTYATGRHSGIDLNEMTGRHSGIDIERDLNNSSTLRQLDALDALDKESEEERDAYEMRHMEHLVFSILPDNSASRTIQAWVSWYISIREPARVGLLARVVHHSAFELMCVTVIAWNAGFAAYVADWEIQNLGQEPTGFISSVEFALLCFYFVELLLRVAVHRLYFFFNDQWRWNVFDVVLVAVSAYDQRDMAASILGLEHGSGASGSNVTFMRAFRLAKLGKVMRLFRVFHFCQDLRLMLLAIERSLTSLFWCLCLLAFVLYIFGLVLQQGVTHHLLDRAVNANTSSGDEVFEGETGLAGEEGQLRSAFGSMTNTTLSLYKATTGGADWGEYYNLVADVGPGYGSLFIFYTAFFTFTVMNILTGMIVENVVKMTQGDDECMMLAYKRQQASTIKEITRLFNQIDRTGSGLITLEQFMESLELDTVRALLNVIELDIKDAEWFFGMLLSVSGTGKVDVAHFVDACMKLKGTATSVDLQCVSYEVRLIRLSLAALLSKSAGGGIDSDEACQSSRALVV